MSAPVLLVCLIDDGTPDIHRDAIIRWFNREVPRIAFPDVDAAVTWMFLRDTALPSPTSFAAVPPIERFPDRQGRAEPGDLALALDLAAAKASELGAKLAIFLIGDGDPFPRAGDYERAQSLLRALTADGSVLILAASTVGGPAPDAVYRGLGAIDILRILGPSIGEMRSAFRWFRDITDDDKQSRFHAARHRRNAGNN